MKNPLDLTGKTILVTGASSGIGRAIAVYLSELGATLVVSGRDESRLTETTGQLSGTGHRQAAMDLGDVDAIPPWMRELSETAGPLHGVVHCAGVQNVRPLRMIKDADIAKLMSVNLNAAFGLAKAFRQKGVAAPGGGLVMISSVAGLTGQPGASMYSASKGGLVALARSLALELAGEHIRVNCIAPAMIMTEMAEDMQRKLAPEKWQELLGMHPLGLGEPQDVAAAVAFLLAPTGRWITGTTLVVDGGYTAH